MGLIKFMADSIRQGLRSFLRVNPAHDKIITINERTNHMTECACNRVWYRGKSELLSDLYAELDVPSTMFWKASSTPGLEIRKIHTGLPALMCDTIANIIIADYNGFEISSKSSTAPAERWEQIEKENNFADTLSLLLHDLCVVGDGALKISYDKEISDTPIIEWYGAENVDYTYVRGHIREVKFYTDYFYKNKRYLFEETYGYGYINYALFNDNGKELPPNSIPALSWVDCKGVTFNKDYIWAVPVLFGKSCHKGRGAGIIGAKTDAFDSLDEVWSQWMDALRAGRTTKYIPDVFLHYDPETGEIQKSNAFDNRFIAVQSDTTNEKSVNKITVESPTIQHDSYLSSYITALDLCLQGVLSPSTLGIDTKKLDNAEAQREKEKTTLYTRQTIIELLNNALPKLVKAALQADSLVHNSNIDYSDIEISVKFGEYANPSFESQVETVAKAKTAGLMSIEQIIEELYGDSKSDVWKEQEVKRIKEEQGIAFEDETSELDDISPVQTPAESINMLNGAQITSLLSIIQSYKEGAISRNAALSIVTSTLGVSQEAAESFIEENLNG